MKDDSFDHFQSSDVSVLRSSHHLFHLSALFSVISCNNFSSSMYVGSLKLLLDYFCGNRVFRWVLSSAVTFAAVVLWFLDAILFIAQQSLSLSSSFQPLFLLADDVFPWFVYAIITLETAALDTPKEVVVLITDAPAKCAPTVCPLWKYDKSPILQYFHMSCY